MHRSEIFAINLRGGIGDAHMRRRWTKHGLLGVGAGCRLGAGRDDCTVKFRARDGKLLVFDSCFQGHDQYSYVKIPNEHAQHISRAIEESELLLFILEGVPGAVVAVPYFIESAEEFFGEVRNKYRTRLESYDLPPHEITSVNATYVASCVYRELCDRDPEIFSVGAQRFLNSTHILS
jgi:hypothetical protein